VSRTHTTAPRWLLPAAAGVIIAGIVLSVISSALAVAAAVIALVAAATDIALTVRRWSW
jgi:hypothetical protein